MHSLIVKACSIFDFDTSESKMQSDKLYHPFLSILGLILLRWYWSNNPIYQSPYLSFHSFDISLTFFFYIRLIITSCEVNQSVFRIISISYGFRNFNLSFSSNIISSNWWKSFRSQRRILSLSLTGSYITINSLFLLLCNFNIGLTV